MAGKLGGKVGIAPRIFLKKLVGDILDRIDQHPDFDPKRHYALTLTDAELTFDVTSASDVCWPDYIVRPKRR